MPLKKKSTPKQMMPEKQKMMASPTAKKPKSKPKRKGAA
jgi:hypothetical protein